MPPTKFRSSQDWLEQSKLLVQARPDTTKVTTKYAIRLPKPSTKPKRSKTKDADAAAATDSTAAAAEPTAADSTTPTAADDAPKKARGVLVLKTYDPVSGVVLKYRTTKAAEVTRLVNALAQLSRTMAGLPDETEDVPMPDAAGAAAGADEAGRDGAAAEGAAAGVSAQQAQPAQTGGGGGGKKRKKGKK
jgi:hypothetical protein